MIAVEYPRALVTDAGGCIVEFKPCAFKGRTRFMAFVADDFPMMYFQSNGFSIHGMVKEAPPEKLAVPRLGRDAAYSLPETLAHALLRGWTLEDLWGAGKGCQWDDEGGRGTCGLTVTEAALASPPPGWVPGQVERPWNMPGWLPPAQSWRAPESANEGLVLLAARENVPVVQRVNPADIAEVPEVEPAELSGEVEESASLSSVAPDGWSSEEWADMRRAVREANITETPGKGRLEYLWKHKVTSDKRRRMPPLSDEAIVVLVKADE